MGALRETIKRCESALVGVMFGGLVVMCSFNFFSAQKTDPYTHLGATALSAQVVYGDPLVVRFTGLRNRLCGAMGVRSFINLSNGRVVHQDAIPSGFVKLGEFDRTIEIPLPPKMGPGSYALDPIVTSDCGTEVIPAAFPRVLFSIINQG